MLPERYTNYRHKAASSVLQIRCGPFSISLAAYHEPQGQHCLSRPQLLLLLKALARVPCLDHLSSHPNEEWPSLWIACVWIPYRYSQVQKVNLRRSVDVSRSPHEMSDSIQRPWGNLTELIDPYHCLCQHANGSAAIPLAYASTRDLIMAYSPATQMKAPVKIVKTLAMNIIRLLEKPAFPPSRYQVIWSQKAPARP